LAITIANIQTYTDSDLRTLYRNALAQLAISKSTTVGGRTVTRSDIPSIIKALEYIEGRIEADDTGSIGLAYFRDQK